MQNNVTKGEFEVFDASNYRIGIVTAQFNKDISSGLEDAARAKLKTYSVSDEAIDIFEVPGCVEIPVILQKLASTKKYDALIAIGTIIRGETPHFDAVMRTVINGALHVSLDNTIPVGMGVLTLENKMQAEPRLHVGADAAVAALNSAKIISEN